MKLQNCPLNLLNYHLSAVMGVTFHFQLNLISYIYVIILKMMSKLYFVSTVKIQDKWSSIESEVRHNQTCDKNDKVQRLSPPDLIDQCISRNSTCPWTCSFLRERTQFKIWTKRFSTEKQSLSQQPCFHGIQQPWTFLYQSTMTNAPQAFLDWFLFFFPLLE